MRASGLYVLCCFSLKGAFTNRAPKSILQLHIPNRSVDGKGRDDSNSTWASSVEPIGRVFEIANFFSDMHMDN